jgi:hypothetical protein
MQVPRDFCINSNEEREDHQQIISARRPQLPQLNDDADDIIDSYRELGSSATVILPPPKSSSTLNDIMYSNSSSRPVSSARIQPSASRGTWSDDEDNEDDFKMKLIVKVLAHFVVCMMKPSNLNVLIVLVLHERTNLWLPHAFSISSSTEKSTCTK